MKRFISRRGLLWSAAGAAGAVAVVGAGSAAVCGRVSQASLDAMPERLYAMLPEVFEPLRLARHWQASASETDLVDEILSRPALLTAVETECPEKRRNIIRTQFADDFLVGDIVLANRLLVARSEYLVAAFCMASHQVV